MGRPRKLSGANASSARGTPPQKAPKATRRGRAASPAACVSVRPKRGSAPEAAGIAASASSGKAAGSAAPAPAARRGARAVAGGRGEEVPPEPRKVGVKKVGLDAPSGSRPTRGTGGRAVPEPASEAAGPKGGKRAKPEAPVDAALEAAGGGGADGSVGAKRPKRSPAEAKAGWGAGPKAKAAGGGGKGQPSREKEARLWEKGYETVAGVDEAGRGPLAGPVVAAACILPRDYAEQGINDSKKLTEEEREELYEALVGDKRVRWATCTLDHKRIDEINILAATMEAMSAAVSGLKGAAKFVLIDGNRCPKDMEVPCEAVVQGDAKCTSIAAASIIAKVTRDRLMRAYHDKWPEYNFAKHKGYGTADHVSAIFKHGASPIHRMTFAPLKNMKA